MKSERRKNTRFSVVDDAYAALVPNFTEVGRIKDISISGLSIEYLSDSDSGSEISSVDIFLRSGEFHLYHLPCKIVYSINLEAPEDDLLSNQMPIRKRCGVKFIRLSENHDKQLRDFLKDHTVGPIKI